MELLLILNYKSVYLPGVAEKHMGGGGACDVTTDGSGFTELNPHGKLLPTTYIVI